MVPELRPATPDDVDVITEVWHRGWADGHVGHVPAGLAAHRGRNEFLSRVPDQIPFTTVAVVDGTIVGFVMVHADEVEQMYVAPTARGRGVADALLVHGEQVVAATHPVAWLAVVSGNARARRFYERSGWHDAGPTDYRAYTADGPFIVPCRRYEKTVRR